MTSAEIVLFCGVTCEESRDWIQYTAKVGSPWLLVLMKDQQILSQSYSFS